MGWRSNRPQLQPSHAISRLFAVRWRATTTWLCSALHVCAHQTSLLRLLALLLSEWLQWFSRPIMSYIRLNYHTTRSYDSFAAPWALFDCLLSCLLQYGELVELAGVKHDHSIFFATVAGGTTVLFHRGFIDS